MIAERPGESHRRSAPADWGQNQAQNGKTRNDTEKDNFKNKIPDPNPGFFLIPADPTEFV
jgi:hypothetical protein